METCERKVPPVSSISGRGRRTEGSFSGLAALGDKQQHNRFLRFPPPRFKFDQNFRRFFELGEDVVKGGDSGILIVIEDVDDDEGDSGVISEVRCGGLVGLVGVEGGVNIRTSGP